MPRYEMGEETLSTLTRQTSSANQNLGALVRKLAAAADPIEKDFQGAGKVAFMQLKSHTDEIANALNSGLTSVLRGVGGMDKAFVQGEQQQADETRSLMASANFEAARFGNRG